MFDRFRKILTVILILVSITGLSISIYMIVSQLQEYGEGKESYKKLENFIEMPDPDITEIISDESVDKITQELQISLPEVDFAALKKLNPDIVGWIYIEETNINYPVVQGSDNQYYLKHLFNGEYNSSGCIFLDII